VELLASIFVSKPLNIFAVAAALMVIYLFLRFSASGKGKSTNALLYATFAWVLYAAWEWFVSVKSPEADIRVDLLMIWPILGLLTIWAVFRLFR
jgi:hypothetical protein